VLVAALMITQSFLYNAIFFTSALVREYFFHVKATDTAYYFFAFAAGNLAGPLTLGRLFDTVGRKKMISSTYITAGVLLIISAVMFKNGMLTATTQTIWWAVVFFFASAGASAGYLTASEVFPLEVRAQSIAVFFAIAQIFGAFGTHWYGHLIGNGTDRNNLFIGYMVGAGAMIFGGIVAIFFGVNAEGKALEDVATPLSVIGKPAEAIFRSGADDAVLDPTVPYLRTRGAGPAVPGNDGDGSSSGSVPDPRLAEHDNPSRTRRRPDDGMPLT
jgi:MFS family permease